MGRKRSEKGGGTNVHWKEKKREREREREGEQQPRAPCVTNRRGRERSIIECVAVAMRASTRYEKSR